MNLLVFTDLDGTLLEHESYSAEPARTALSALAARGIAPIINSSKTRDEISKIQEKLDLKAPFISENGAALYDYNKQGLDETIKEFGISRNSWLQSVHQLREQLKLKFEGFADWDIVQLAQATGLTAEEASLALHREYSEPILWRDTSKAFSQFKSSLLALDLQLVEGGRFFSVQGSHDKATAIKWLKQQHRTDESSTDEPITVALGDSPNDRAMLEAVDVAVLIKSAKTDQIEITGPKKVIRSSRPGPAGWQDAILDILQQFDTGTLLKRSSAN